MICVVQGRYRSLLCLSYETRCLDIVAGWEPYDLHDIAHVLRVGSVLHRSFTKHTMTTQIGSIDDLDDLDHLSQIVICPMCE